jgi:hypothetical protein
MRHQIPVILTAVGFFAGIAAIRSSGGHWYVASLLYVACVGFLAFAFIAALYEGLPKPRIVIVGVGSIENVTGLLIENEGEPAYNITPPRPVQLSGAMVVFNDPIIPRFASADGRRCFPMEVQTSLGSRSGVGPLYQDMALRGINELEFEFSYADGKKPSRARYTTVGKLQLIRGNVVAVFVDWQFRWSSLIR